MKSGGVKDEGMVEVSSVGKKMEKEKKGESR